MNEVLKWSPKTIGIVMTIILFAHLTGCGSKAIEDEQKNYTVVKIADDVSIEELFDFESVTKVALSGALSKLGIEEGVYGIGALSNGHSVVWRSDDDPYAYDDDLFVYVEDSVSKQQVISFVAKPEDTPITYDDFREKYE